MTRCLVNLEPAADNAKKESMDEIMGELADNEAQLDLSVGVSANTIDRFQRLSKEVSFEYSSL